MRWCRTQASSHQAQRVVDGLGDEARVSTSAPNKRKALCSRVDQGQGSYAQRSGTSPQLDPAGRLKRVTRVVNFLRSDSRCRRYVSDLSSLMSRSVGSAKKCVMRPSAANLSLRVASWLYRWKAAVTALVILRFSFHFCKYDDRVAMSCVKIPSNDCWSSAECMMAGSSS